MDRVSQEQRSRNMSRIRGRDTTPEMKIRTSLHRLGYRYRTCEVSLPGKPDLVFKKRRKVLFIHGCFWHQHEGCSRAFIPDSRKQFWLEKFRATAGRDIRTLASLTDMGWTAMVLWECEIREPSLIDTVITFLGPAAHTSC